MGKVHSHSNLDIQQPRDYSNRFAQCAFFNVPSARKASRADYDRKTRKPTSFNQARDDQRQLETAPSQPPLKRPSHEEDASSNEMQMKFLELQNQDDFRVSFLRKLSCEKVWVPAAQRPPTHQTVIIFDWDDTLLCTSYLNQRDGLLLHPTIQHVLREIGRVTKELLEMSLQMGHTFIITNAMEGWVEYSASRYIPEVLPVLQKLKIVSARTKYETFYPHNIAKWKICAFLDVQRQLDLPIITNLNSFGDSAYEMDATAIMGNEFSQALVKTVKFKENPSPAELFKQIELVSQRFERIVGNARNLKINLEGK